MRIYLAGPDVFRPDALNWAENARTLLAEHGHQALIPLDNDETTAGGIYAANIALIRAADAVIANLNPFRGIEPDSGTCFEVGYASALGKPVIAYLADTRSQAEKIAEIQGRVTATRDGRPVDRDGLFVEDFQMPVNLMLGLACQVIHGGLLEAVIHLKAPWGSQDAL